MMINHTFLGLFFGGKAQYIVNAVMAYQRMQERGEFPASEEVLFLKAITEKDHII